MKPQKITKTKKTNKSLKSKKTKKSKKREIKKLNAAIQKAHLSVFKMQMVDIGIEKYHTLLLIELQHEKKAKARKQILDTMSIVVGCSLEMARMIVNHFLVDQLRFNAEERASISKKMRDIVADAESVGFTHNQSEQLSLIWYKSIVTSEITIVSPYRMLGVILECVETYKDLVDFETNASLGLYNDAEFNPASLDNVIKWMYAHSRVKFDLMMSSRFERAHLEAGREAYNKAFQVCSSSKSAFEMARNVFQSRCDQ